MPARSPAYNLGCMEPLKVGDRAPDFDLPISGPERLKLSDALAKGPVVLLAYVFDFTGG